MTPRNRRLMHQQHVLLMDPRGTQFGLPFESSTPFAYYLSRKGRIGNLRRYGFGRVYRSRVGALPKEAGEASFDLVCGTHAPVAQRRLEDAEVIRVLMEVLHAFPVEGADSYIVTVSYKGLAQGILEANHVPSSHCENVYRAMLHTRKLGRSAGRRKLAHELHGLECAGSLTSLMNRLWESHDKGLPAQIKVLQDAVAGSPGGSEALRQLRRVLHLAVAMLPSQQDRIRIVIDPALSLATFQDGLMIHAGIKTQKKHIERVVATGGRYDSTVSTFLHARSVRKLSSHTLRCGVVGICFSIDRLCADETIFHNTMTALESTVAPKSRRSESA